jgi:hypothetical protein
MGFKAGQILIQDEIKKEANPKGLPSLSSEEIMFLLKIIHDHKFEGKEVEILFNVTLKLQQLYLNSTK